MNDMIASGTANNSDNDNRQLLKFVDFLLQEKTKGILPLVDRFFDDAFGRLDTEKIVVDESKNHVFRLRLLINTIIKQTEVYLATEQITQRDQEERQNILNNLVQAKKEWMKIRNQFYLPRSWKTPHHFSEIQPLMRDRLQDLPKLVLKYVGNEKMVGKIEPRQQKISWDPERTERFLDAINKNLTTQTVDEIFQIVFEDAEYSDLKTAYGGMKDGEIVQKFRDKYKNLLKKHKRRPLANFPDIADFRRRHHEEVRQEIENERKRQRKSHGRNQEDIESLVSALNDHDQDVSEDDNDDEEDEFDVGDIDED